ncbi:MAG: WD_0033/WD_0034 family tandem repeat-containing protein [Wolbachia sp.]
MVKLKNANEKDILYQSVYGLTQLQEERILKLAIVMEEGNGIAEKFKKRLLVTNYNPKKILTARIIYENEEFTLLYHAIHHENNQAIKDILEKAEEQGLLEEVLNEKMIVKCRDGKKVIYSIKKDEISKFLKGQAINLKDMFQVTTTIEQESLEETHAILVDAISRKDDSTVRATLTVSKSTGILKDLLNKMVAMKHKDGQEVTCTLLDYAKLCKNSKAEDEILKVARDAGFLEKTAMNEPKDYHPSIDIEEVLEAIGENLEVEEQNDIPHTETNTQLYEDTNKNSEDPQHICESKEDAQNASVDTTVREPNTPEIQPSTEPCSGSGKGNSVGEKSSNQLIVAGVVGVVLLVGSVASYIMNMPIVAVVGGIVGLACIGFALYNALNPNTKLEEVEQPLVSFEPNSMLKSSR